MQLNQHYNGLYYETSGTSGNWIVFFHGFCECSQLWDDVLPTKPNLRVLLIDLPGFGKSKSFAFESLDLMGQKVAELLHYLQIDNPIIIGHSMGGYLAVQMIKSGLINPKALGMIHSTFHSDGDEKKVNRDRTIQFLRDNPATAFLKAFTEGLFAPFNTKNENLMFKAQDMVSNNETKTLQNTLLAMRNRNSSIEWLEASELPILIVAGAHDLHIPLQISLDEASRCKRGMLEVLTQSGHLGQLEQPALTKQVIENFILWVEDLPLL